jgi:hypothetical protein
MDRLTAARHRGEDISDTIVRLARALKPFVNHNEQPSRPERGG